MVGNNETIVKELLLQKKQLPKITSVFMRLFAINHVSLCPLIHLLYREVCFAKQIQLISIRSFLAFFL